MANVIIIGGGSMRNHLLIAAAAFALTTPATIAGEQAIPPSPVVLSGKPFDRKDRNPRKNNKKFGNPDQYFKRKQNPRPGHRPNSR